MTVIDPFAGVEAVRVKSVQFTTKNGKLVYRINNSNKFPLIDGEDFEYYKDLFIDGDLFVIPDDLEDGRTLFRFASLETLNYSHKTYHLKG